MNQLIANTSTESNCSLDTNESRTVSERGQRAQMKVKLVYPLTRWLWGVHNAGVAFDFKPTGPKLWLVAEQTQSHTQTKYTPLVSWISLTFWIRIQLQCDHNSQSKFCHGNLLARQVSDSSAQIWTRSYWITSLSLAVSDLPWTCRRFISLNLAIFIASVAGCQEFLNPLAVLSLTFWLREAWRIHSIEFWHHFAPKLVL